MYNINSLYLVYFNRQAKKLNKRPVQRLQVENSKIYVIFSFIIRTVSKCLSQGDDFHRTDFHSHTFQWVTHLVALLNTHMSSHTFCCVALALCLDEASFEYMGVRNFQCILAIAKGIESYMKTSFFFINHGQVHFSLFSSSLALSIFYNSSVWLLFNADKVGLVQDLISQSDGIDIYA